MNWRTRGMAIGVAAGMAVAAAVAVFAWSATATGNGSVQDTTAIPISVAAASGAPDLYPAGPAGAIYFTLSNPNPYPVTFTAIAYGTPAVASAPNATSTQPCPASAVRLDPAKPTTVSIALRAHDTNVAETVSGVLDLDASAPDACQGATFTVQITLTGVQTS